MSDGAGAVIIASEDAVKKHNFTPLARVVGYFVSGCDPTIMGIGKFIMRTAVWYYCREGGLDIQSPGKVMKSRPLGGSVCQIIFMKNCPTHNRKKQDHVNCHKHTVRLRYLKVTQRD